MSWVKLDDAIYDHPKLAPVPNASLWVWTCGLAYANRHGTDGLVERHVLRIISGTSRDAGALVTAGLWVPTDAGWEIHDYHDYQPSRAVRQKRSEAGRRGAQARWNGA
jgi:hypothetical protein